MGTVLNTAELLSARNVKSAELKELGVAAICIPPGEEGLAHSHTLIEEVVIVHKGKGAIQIEDETFELRAGSIAVVPAGKFHALSNTGKKNFEATAIFNSNVDRSKALLLECFCSWMEDTAVVSPASSLPSSHASVTSSKR